MADVEIVDEAGLEAWLETRPRRDAEIIAFRAAARVFPLWGRAMEEEWAVKNGLSSLTFLRPLISASNLDRPKVDIGRDVSAIVTDHFSTRASFWAISAAYALVGARPFSPFFEVGFAQGAFDAVTDHRPHRFNVSQVMISAETAVQGIQLSRDGTWLNDGSFEGSGSPTKQKLVRWLREFYRQIDADCKRMSAGSSGYLDLFGSMPLWLGAEPDWFQLPDKRTRAIWAKDPDTWAFWVRWWDGVIAGKPLPFDLQRDVALIEEGIWQQGPKAVAEAIAKIEAARSPQPARELTPDQVLDRAIAKLPPAKEIAVAAVRQAVIAHRVDLLENFAALQGFIALEITRLQTINYMSDEHRDLCIQQAKR